MSDSSYVYINVSNCSVMGPVLFGMFTMPLNDIINHHSLLCMTHAEDIQLYITCGWDQLPASTIEESEGDIRHWMRKICWP